MTTRSFSAHRGRPISMHSTVRLVLTQNAAASVRMHTAPTTRVTTAAALASKASPHTRSAMKLKKPTTVRDAMFRESAALTAVRYGREVHGREVSIVHCTRESPEFRFLSASAAPAMLETTSVPSISLSVGQPKRRRGTPKCTRDESITHTAPYSCTLASESCAPACD